jgi:aryl carrier-like protein
VHGTAAAFAGDSSLVALGLDSMGIARLSSRLEDTFGVSLPPRVLYSLPTLADLEACLFGGDVAVRRVAMRAELVNWQYDAEKAFRDLEEELATAAAAVALPHGDSTSAGSGQGVDTLLLTGATGFLGAFLLRALTSDMCSLHCSRIVCVVRAKDDAVANTRLRDSLKGYGIPYDQQRVTALAGDLEADRLGLESSVYFALAARLQCVLHCGARVSSSMPYNALREPNVAGTRRALALALLSGGGRGSYSADFVHVSTMGFLPLGV